MSRPHPPRRQIVPIPARVAELIEAGWTSRSIAMAAGVAPSTLHDAITTGKVTAPTARRLMAADMDAAPRQPAWRATRRMRALVAAGVPIDTLAAEVGTTRPHFHEILHGKTEQIHRDLFAAIDRVWRARENNPVTEPPPWVIAREWAVPWAWDDIDDPATDLHADRITDSTAVQAAVARARKEFGDEATAKAIGIHRYRLSEFPRTPRMLTSRSNQILGDLRRLRARERDAMIRAEAAA